MSSFLESIGEVLIASLSSPLALSVVALCGACMRALLYVFVTNARNAKLRVSLLTGLYALSIFFWAFVAVSSSLCAAEARMVAYAHNGVPMAVLGAVAGGSIATCSISAIVWRYGNAAVVRRFEPRELHDDERWLQQYADLLREFEGIPPVHLRLVESDEALALAIGGKERNVLVSRGLLSILEKDELETVAAHELMHLKHHDAEFKVFSRVLSRILFFDPFSKFFDPAVHREREYLADEMSGRATGKPAALASALLKLAALNAPTKASWGLSISGPGHGVFSRYPPLDERTHRLLLLSDLLASG